jgi:ATP-dependent helicase HrpA
VSVVLSQSLDVSLINQCQTLDRFDLEQRKKTIESRQKSGKPVSRSIQQWQEKALASAQTTEQRLSLIGTIDYPDLPVTDKKEAIKEAIRDHQVVVIAGETGSGKTTQLPKICLELGLGARGLIGHTQPRRLAARTVANRIADELHKTLGDKVGYQVRFTDQVSENSLIKLMTDGILLAETQHDRYLNRYEVIIIDEAHERSLNIDFLLGYLKRLLPKRPDLKVIITSATIDLDRFSKHFNDAPVIEVSGRTFPVDVLYRPLFSEEEDSEDRTQQQGILDALDEIRTLEKRGHTGPRDVLVFLSGEREIRETAERLRKADLRDTEVVPLYARLSLAEQNRVFDQKRTAYRRVVLSTNVAETSLTVPGIGYVIDSGFARISRYSYRSKVQRLPIEAISKASANQRAGRCGRIAPGVCIRLYSEEDFKQRPDFTDAEIRRTNLAAVILQMLHLRLGSISEFPFIDPPDPRFVNDGFKLLEELAAVGPKRELTTLGRKLARLPVDPRLGRMILEADRQGALNEILIIASALSVQDPRERPNDKQQAADQRHAVDRDDDSDFVTLINLWNRYEEQRQALSQNQLRQYCKAQFLSFLRMREWRDVHRQLVLVVRDMKMSMSAEPADYKSVHQSLLSGLLSHMGFKQENREYLGARNRRFHIFPASSLFKKSPKWVMAAELVETSKVYARCVAKIDPLWAEPLAEHLIKKTHLEPVWQKKRAQVVAIEQVTLYGLLIVPKRYVHYGAIDPDTSHDIFIRSALVEGDYETRAGFFEHNRSLLEEVEELEAKSRRKDLLVDEDTLFDFYERTLSEHGGAHIVNGKGFEAWRKQLEQDHPKALYLTEEDILQRSADHISKKAYPDELHWRGVKLPLTYHFDPGADDDGVSLEVPLALLKQLPVQRLDWLVPGMLEAKCEALLRGLPKQLRKQCVPVPDYAKALYEALMVPGVFGEGDLFSVMAHQLKRMLGHPFDEGALRHANLDDHHRINFRVLNEKGKLLAQSRDLDALIRSLGQQVDDAVQQTPGDTWGRKGITSWDFGTLPTHIRLKQAGGMEVDAWPMLVAGKDSCELKVAMNPEWADHQTRLGVLLLARKALSVELKNAVKQLPKLNESTLLVSKVMDKASLLEGIQIQALNSLMELDDSLPRDQADFDRRLTLAKSGLKARLLEVAAIVFEVHTHFHKVQSALNGRQTLETITILKDVQMQLSALVYKGYLNNISWFVFNQYTRYMKAIEIRLEKFAREIPRQRLLSDQLSSYYQSCFAAMDKLKSIGEWQNGLDRFRWYLEEYRISLFAQQVGTLETVSEKRVAAEWRALQAD